MVEIRDTISSRNMAYSARTLRIASASILALLMIGGTYAFTGPNPLLSFANIADAQSSEELLREYAAKDTDVDGLADWQEVLYGTDPENPESFKAGVRDGEAVAQGLITPKVQATEPEQTDISTIPGTTAAPTSLTERFAQTLLKEYLTNRGETPPSTEDIVAFVEKGVGTLSNENISAPHYALKDVKTGGDNSAEGLVAYAASVEYVFAKYTVPTDKNELSYFSEALKGDAAALKKIEDISDAYANIAKGMIALQVPPEARQSHLAIANALIHMSEITEDMASMETDPLRSLLGIGLYDKYAVELVSAFTNLDGVFDARSVTIPEGVKGYFIVKTANDAAKVQ